MECAYIYIYICTVSKGKDTYKMDKNHRRAVRYWNLILILTQMLSVALFTWYKQQVDETGQFQIEMLHSWKIFISKGNFFSQTLKYFSQSIVSRATKDVSIHYSYRQDQNFSLKRVKKKKKGAFSLLVAYVKKGNQNTVRRVAERCWSFTSDNLIKMIVWPVESSCFQLVCVTAVLRGGTFHQNTVLWQEDTVV